MKLLPSLIASALAGALLTGCGRNEIRTHYEALQAPASHEEARRLMREVDTAALADQWEEAALRVARSRMTGRLLNAGLTQAEIEEWIASPRTGLPADRSRKNLASAQ
jgi:hypothetical protein